MEFEIFGALEWCKNTLRRGRNAVCFLLYYSKCTVGDKCYNEFTYYRILYSFYMGKCGIKFLAFDRIRNVWSIIFHSETIYMKALNTLISIFSEWNEEKTVTVKFHLEIGNLFWKLVKSIFMIYFLSIIFLIRIKWWYMVSFWKIFKIYLLC